MATMENPYARAACLKDDPTTARSIELMLTHFEILTSIAPIWARTRSNSASFNDYDLNIGWT